MNIHLSPLFSNSLIIHSSKPLSLKEKLGGAILGVAIACFVFYVIYRIMYRWKWKVERIGNEKKITYLSGRIEQGTFANGKLLKGKRTDPDGTIQEGTFKNGKLDGPKCKIESKNGVIEEGAFKNGLMEDPNGHMTFFSQEPNRKCELTGAFVKGLPCGGGPALFKLFQRDITSGESIVDEGIFELKGRICTLNGPGKVTCVKYSKIGIFKDRKLISGKILFQDGMEESGHFKGSCNWAQDGTIGHEKLEGQGKRTYPDGRIQNGIFKEGILVTPNSILT